MRHYVLISYDICNSKRLQKVHGLVLSYARPLQYSVFISQLSDKDFALLREKLKDIINHKKDKVIMIRLAPVVDDKDFDSKWTILGKKLETQKSGDFIC